MEQLVTTDWLADNLGSAGIAILDASQHMTGTERDERREFLAGHIPGARFLDLAGLVDESSPVPKALPQGGQIQERLRRLGIREGQRIVLYDDSAIRSSARAWFILRMYGLEHVAILDGGLGKWRAEGRPLETGEVEAARSDISVSEAAPRVRTKADMLANIASEREQVVDARDAERFAGTAATDPHGQPGGHIPGSCNLHFARLFAPDGTYRPPAELRREFELAGIDLDRPVVASCGSGMTASVLLFALSLIGRSEAALYDGSWLEWGSDPDTPKNRRSPR